MNRREEEVVKYFTEHPRAFISEISARTGVPRSTIQNYLKKNSNLLIPGSNNTIGNQLLINKTRGNRKGGNNFFKNNDIIKDESGKIIGTNKTLEVDKDVRKNKDINIICTYYLDNPGISISDVTHYFKELGLYTKDYIYDCLTSSKVAHVMGLDKANLIKKQLGQNKYSFLRKCEDMEIDNLILQANLSDLEKEIITSRMNGDISLEELGEKYSLSKTSIMKIEDSAIEKLRNNNIRKHNG